MNILSYIEKGEKKSNLNLFVDYYKLFMNSGDCDPAFPALNYICDRFELNIEQRYWIAFLYGTNYCAPTVYYIYNEFPDFENVNISRMRRWWKDNKEKTLFQTDRAKVKNFDFFVKIVKSYIELIGSSQEDSICSTKSYEELYKLSSKIFYFGRFSIFNYTQALWELTNTRLIPTFFDLKQAESCRNGLCYVFDRKEFITKKQKAKINYGVLDKDLEDLLLDLKKRTNLPVNMWNVETALCAYKKLFWGTRYLFYYIDRQQEEISILQKKVKQGVNWKPLWDFRKEFFDNSIIGEINNWDGIRKNRMNIFRYRRVFGNAKSFDTYKRKVNFINSGKCYE